MSVAGSGPRRGRIGLYAVAFVLLVASLYAQAKGNLESSLRLVWLSIGLSGLAVVAAGASLLLRPRGTGQGKPRRVRPAPPADGTGER